MTEMGQILIADDEETFLISTADLLRIEGYKCDCTSNSIEAVEKLQSVEYDLLIADIKMQGNFELELIQYLPQIVQYLPVILVTGYPSMKSAIQSIELPVMAYLVKPIDFGELLEKVRISTQNSRLVKTVKDIRKRLQQWNEDLKAIEEIVNIMPQNESSMHVETFINLTFHNIIGAILDLKHLTDTPAIGSIKNEICHLFNCPRLRMFRKALFETIEVIENTKSSFKSRDLGELRKKLEGLLKES
jgi:CheY-like chemotaxis protein